MGFFLPGYDETDESPHAVLTFPRPRRKLHPPAAQHPLAPGGKALRLTEKTQDHAKMTLPSDLSSVDRIEQTAFDYARRAGFDEDTASNVAMVAREAAVNAIQHGNQFDPGKQIQAGFELSPDALTIRVADQGAGLDMNAVPDPLQPENLLRTSGRGIFLMKAFMDEVHLRQLTPGTEIVLIKRRP